MIKIKAQFDLSVFVEGLKHFTLEQAISDIEKEILRTESSLSRDPRTSFSQVRYARSLKRLLGLLKDHQVPHDLTPKECSAFNELIRTIENVPDPLAVAFRQMPAPLAHAS